MTDLLISIFFLMVANAIIIYALYGKKWYKLSLFFSFVQGMFFLIFLMTFLIAFDKPQKKPVKQKPKKPLYYNV